MKSVLMSTQPKWCELIASGEKTVEVRKTKPKLETPFKVYIYCTKNTEKRIGHWLNLYCDSKQVTTDIKLEEPCYPLNGKVIGEFVCDRIQPFESEFVDDDCYEFVASLDYDEDGDATGFIEWSNDSDFSYESTVFYKKCCVKYEELKNYMGQGFSEFFGWHISDLVIYAKPKELREFRKYNPFFEGISTEELEAEGVSGMRIKRPPQSWCYVEEGAE